jgi:hypothetical protein
MPVVVALTASVIVEMGVSNAANTLIRAWASAAKSWVTDWVALSIVDEFLTSLTGVVWIADTSSVHVLGGVWNTGSAVVVGLSATSTIASVVTGVVCKHVTGESCVVHVTDTGTELVEMGGFDTADAVHVGWAGASSEASWMAILNWMIWLWVPDLTTLSMPVRVAHTLVKVVARGMVCAVCAVIIGRACAAEAHIMASVL